MGNVFSVQDGDWNTASTWDTGTVPASTDIVFIRHKVTLKANAAATTVMIWRGGSLMPADDWNMTTSATLECFYMGLSRDLHDNRKVRLDGINLNITYPGISCSTDEYNDGIYPTTNSIVQTADQIIFDDPGAMGFTAQMRDIKPEGCVRAYAEKVGNAVRYMTITVHIKADKGNVIGMLYRIAESPYQVLASTYSGVIKGYIEAITPVDSVGKEYRSFRISIAEGL